MYHYCDIFLVIAVLPKFEITIQTPKYITTKEDNVAVKFCAK